LCAHDGPASLSTQGPATECMWPISDHTNTERASEHIDWPDPSHVNFSLAGLQTTTWLHSFINLKELADMHVAAHTCLSKL